MPNSKSFDKSTALSNLDRCLQLKDLKSAVKIGNAALIHDPEFHEARHRLARTHILLKQYNLALNHFRYLYLRFPLEKGILFELGNTEASLGNFPAAIEVFLRLVAMDPENIEVLLRLGRCYGMITEPKAAVIVYIKAVELQPNSASHHFLLGKAFTDAGQYDEAVTALTTAHTLEPESERIIVQLADILRISEQLGPAEAIAVRGLNLHPNSGPLATLLARIYAEQGSNDLAESMFKTACKLDVSGLYAYSEWLQERGRFTESQERLIQSLEQVPHQGHAYFQLTQTRIFSIGEKNIIENCEELKASGALDIEQQMFLAYSLGMAYEHQHRFSDSMLNFNEANRLAYRLYNVGRLFDIESERSQFSTVVEWTKSHLGKQPPASNTSSPNPIFVVGMIRSGTSLLNQVLSSHPLVGSVGEPWFWIRETTQWGSEPGTDIAFEKVSDLANQYLSKVVGNHPNLGWMVDKMPINFRGLGLIHTAFPNSKIIHLTRSPLDTCMSIYSNHFGTSTTWAYKQATIREFYSEYLRNMATWRSLIPNESLYEVAYENLLQNPKLEFQRIFEFCEIPWDERCLDFASNENSIQTPSRWQARQPLYKTSVSRWKNFEPFLGEFHNLKGVTAKYEREIELVNML